MLTNKHAISLPIAIWLGIDDYDMVPAEKKLSCTTLIKPVRAIILGMRAEKSGQIPPADIHDLVASRVGTAIHAAVEKALNSDKVPEVLAALGHPPRVAQSLEIHTEVRTEKPLLGWTISGSADMIIDGFVHDLKTTTMWSYTSPRMWEKYRKQLSIYRWLNQDLIVEDYGFVEFYLKDWSALEASFGKADYPLTPMVQKPIALHEIYEVDAYLAKKLTQIDLYLNTPEHELPLCTDEELGMDASKWQYFANTDSTRATKNFDTMPEAMSHRMSKGKGIVKEKKGKANECRFCKAAHVCSQRKQLDEQGLL